MSTLLYLSLSSVVYAELSVLNYAWTKTAGAAGADGAYKVSLDLSGNIYFVGVFENTVDFDPGAGTDNHTSAGNTDIFLSKYNADGSYAWTKSVGGASNDAAVGVVTDTSANIYITGGFLGTVDFDPGAGTDNHSSAGSDDIFLSKYNSDGSYAWTKSVGGTGIDYTNEVTTDTSDNVYITGSFSGTVDFDPGAGTDNHTSVGSTDIFLSKYNANGSYAWTKSVGGTGFDESYEIATDASGNVYLTGYFLDTVDFDPGAGTDNHTSVGQEDIFLSKYTSNGTYIWTKTVGGTGWDDSSGLSTDTSGNVYLTGFFENTVDFDPGAGTDNHSSAGSDDIFLSKYNSDGSYAWTKTIGSVGEDEGYRVSTDNNGNIYFIGHFTGTVDFDPGSGTDNHTSPLNTDRFLSKYSADGSYAWTRTVDVTDTTSFEDITVDSNNNIYVTGYFNGAVDFDSGSGTDNHTSAGSNDIFLSKYTQTLLQQITGLPPGISATTTSGTDVTSASGVETGDTITVRLSDTGEGIIIADVTTTFSSDLDWSSVSLGSDSTTGKAFVHNLASTPGTANTYTMYVPYVDGHTNVGICPGATMLSEVNDICTDLYYLDESDSNVSISTVSGNQYWVITGLDSTGGFGTTGLADTGEDTTPLYIISVLLISIGIVSTLWYLKFFNRS